MSVRPDSLVTTRGLYGASSGYGLYFRRKKKREGEKGAIIYIFDV